MGGIGKSVLAAAVAWDDKVRRMFSGGILWVTLGQHPALLTRQAQLAEALGDGPRAFTDVQQGTARLSDLLAEAACLLILDDVWQVDQVQAFDALGPGCRILITTRDAGVVRGLGAVEHQLEVLSDAQALTLLAESVGQTIATLPAAAHAVVQECGYLPLALAMVGAMVRGKPDRWENVLYKLCHADLEKIRQQFPNYPYPDLLRAIQVSVEALEPALQTCYLDFAVLPEKTPIAEAVLQIYWKPEGLKVYDVQDVVDTLVDRSLLRRDDEGRLSMHDLQFDYVRKQAGDVMIRHNRLLHAYADEYPEGWSRGPNDGYFFEHLAYHLMEVGRKEELRQLLFDFNWLWAKLDATSVTALIADYGLLSDDVNVRLVQGAIRFSAQTLAEDKTQLAGQLLGRLLSCEAPEIQAMLEQAKRWKAAPWLRPLTPSLTPPGTSVLTRFIGVSTVGVTPDLRHAVSGSGDGTLKVWDLEGKAEQCALGNRTNLANTVAVTPDGQRAISATLDHSLKVWAPLEAEELCTLQGHTDYITAVAIKPDGSRAISAAEDQTVRLWDLNAGTELACLQYGWRINAMIIVRDIMRAVLVSEDNTLRVWNPESGAEPVVLARETGPIRVLVATPDGRRVISSSDRTLQVWDTGSGAQLQTLAGHGGVVRTAAVTPDGKRLISGADDITLIMWDLESGVELRRWEAHGWSITAIAVASDGKSLISASKDETLKVWDLESGNALYTVGNPSQWVNAVVVVETSQGWRAISASRDKVLRVWDVNDGAELHTLSGHQDWVNTLAVTKDGRVVVSGSDDLTVKVWDLESGHAMLTLKGHENGISAVAVMADGRLAISGCWDCTLKVWDLTTGMERHTLKGHTDWVRAVAMMPDERRAISGAHDGHLILWSLERGQEVRRLKVHDGWVMAVAVAPDGRYVISASADETLKLWNLEGDAEPRVVGRHSGFVTGVALSGEGRRAVSTSEDHTLKVWDLEEGNVIARFTADGELRACAMTPDGRTIVAGEDSGRMHFLRLEGIEESVNRG